MNDEEILKICKRIDPTAWAFDAEPDAYVERRRLSSIAAKKEWAAQPKPKESPNYENGYYWARHMDNVRVLEVINNGWMYSESENWTDNWQGIEVISKIELHKGLTGYEPQDPLEKS